MTRRARSLVRRASHARLPLCILLAASPALLVACGDGTSPPGPAARLEIVSGSPQTDTTNAVLDAPIVVRALTADGRAVPGELVEFSTVGGEGTISPAVVATDPSGLAQATWTLGATAGPASARAALQAKPTAAITFTATVEWPKLRAVAMAVGYNHGCAIVAPDRLYCWGANDRGQLGDGTTLDRSIGTPVATGLGFVRVAAGGRHSCALTAAGEAYCWGHNFWGSIGDGTTTDRPLPTAVATDVRFTEIVAGAEHTCALTADGRVYCWGFLVNASAPPPNTPTRVSGTVLFASISSGDYHLCGIDRAGASHCFVSTYAPEGYYGEPGVTWRPSPLASPPTFTAVTGGLDYTCGLNEIGAAYCWGDNSYGQLGTGDYEDRTAPTPVFGNHAFRSLHAGYDWVCGVTLAGANVCWGHNSWSTLGVPWPPHTNPTPQPMSLPAGVSFATLDGGFYHMCGIDDETSLVYCWAAGFNGQLGDGKSSATNEFHHETAPVIAHRR